MRSPTDIKIGDQTLDQILKKHLKWIKEEGGEKADLRGADLRDADLSRADLRGVYLRGVYLRDADLRDADLSRADLRGADLSRADLSRADLRDADLRGADLSRADLSRADLREADLDYASWPLWCFSVGVKVSDRTALQLLYHACAVDYSECSPEIKQALDQAKPTAEKFREWQHEAPRLTEEEDTE